MARILVIDDDQAVRDSMARMLRGAGFTVETAGTGLSALVREWTWKKEDGRIKLFVTFQALHARRKHPGLFATGEYEPVQVEGSRQENACAFIRRQGNAVALTVVPRLPARLVSQPGEMPLGAEVWGYTVLRVPGLGDRPLHNVFTGETIVPVESEGGLVLPLTQVFAHCPVALLMAQDSH